MQKIAVVLPCNTHWAPYYARYKALLDSMNVSYDLIIWNREGIDEKEASKNLIEYRLSDTASNGNALKVAKFIGFSNFVKKQLKSIAYDKIIFLSTYAAMPALLYSYLSKHYRNRYWIDFRDLTYESFKPFYLLEAKALLNAKCVSLSSRKYESCLPKRKYYYMHNIDPRMDIITKQYRKNESDTIRISFIGNIRCFEQCCEMLGILGNDERFTLRFIGPNYERIENYCKEKNIKNVEFHGSFKAKDTVLFYNDTDIIFNIYGNSKKNECCALSNKLYYALRFELPLLVSENTFMEEIAIKYDIGIAFKNDKSFADELYKWYEAFMKRNHQYAQAWNTFYREDKNAIDGFLKFIEE